MFIPLVYLVKPRGIKLSRIDNLHMSIKVYYYESHFSLIGIFMENIFQKNCGKSCEKSWTLLSWFAPIWPIKSCIMDFLSNWTHCELHTDGKSQKRAFYRWTSFMPSLNLCSRIFWHLWVSWYQFFERLIINFTLIMIL